MNASTARFVRERILWIALAAATLAPAAGCNRQTPSQRQFAELERTLASRPVYRSEVEAKFGKPTETVSVRAAEQQLCDYYGTALWGRLGAETRSISVYWHTIDGGWICGEITGVEYVGFGRDGAVTFYASREH